MSDLLHQNYLPTQLVANILGRTIQHTRLLFRHGKIRATKMGRDWLVARSDLAQYLAKCASGLEYHPAQEQIGDGRRVANLADAAPRLFDEPAFTTTNGLLTSVNVAQVPQRSPFRYPGGKTWLVPHVRQWLRSLRPRATVLVEPFAGGGSVSLTAAFEDLTDYVIMVELDEDVAAPQVRLRASTGAVLGTQSQSPGREGESHVRDVPGGGARPILGCGAERGRPLGRSILIRSLQPHARLSVHQGND
jgi:excisionase family DNA binding protein